MFSTSPMLDADNTRRVSEDAPQCALRRTIQSYERFADAYSKLGNPFPPPNVAAPLRWIAEAVGPNGLVLEIGSGPGWEADYLEQRGTNVCRTDATERFLEIQAERGKRAYKLDVISDPLDGPFDAVVALCVLIHVPRESIGAVLSKIAGALKAGGSLFVSMRDGEHESTGDYHTVYWRRESFAAKLEAAGLRIDWYERSVDVDADIWHSYLARRLK